nr:flowering-promoting factor 1-like protein 3 [Ipomoea batatas]
MSGVWVFKNGVVRLVENPGEYQGARKMLIHVRTNEAITSYAVLERKLMALGWERYYDEPELLQYHKRSTVHLISLPRDFNKFRSMHMYDIVVKNRNEFESTPFGIELRVALSTTYKEHNPRALITGAAGCIICWPSDLHGFSQSSCCRFHGSEDVQKHKVADQISCCCTSGYWGDVFHGKVGLRIEINNKLSNCNQHK